MTVHSKLMGVPDAPGPRGVPQCLVWVGAPFTAIINGASLVPTLTIHRAPSASRASVSGNTFAPDVEGCYVVEVTAPALGFAQSIVLVALREDRVTAERVTRGIPAVGISYRNQLRANAHAATMAELDELERSGKAPGDLVWPQGISTAHQ